MRNERIFEILFEFASNKDKKTLKQKFYDYSREVAIESVEKMIKLRRTKLTFKKKIIVLFSCYLCIQEDCIKDEITAFTSR